MTHDGSIMSDLVLANWTPQTAQSHEPQTGPGDIDEIPWRSEYLNVCGSEELP